MNRKSRRLEVRLTPELYEALMNEAQHKGTSMGEMVREAVSDYLSGARTTKQNAVQRLADLSAPIDEWDAIEHQLIQGVADRLKVNRPSDKKGRHMEQERP
jgi:predicted DNA-binding protein